MRCLARGAASRGDFQPCFLGSSPPLCFPLDPRKICLHLTPPRYSARLPIAAISPQLPGSSSFLFTWSLAASQLLPSESYFEWSRSLAGVPSELKWLLVRLSSTEVTDSGSNGVSAAKRPPFPSCLPPPGALSSSAALPPSLPPSPRPFFLAGTQLDIFGSPSTAVGGGKTRRGRRRSDRELGGGGRGRTRPRVRARRGITKQKVGLRMTI